MSKFIPIEWLIKRNDMHVNIDCFEENNQGRKYFKPNCCDYLIDGCDITTCKCNEEYGIRVQVRDINDSIIAESEFETGVNKILIDQDSLGQVIIKIQ